MEKITYTEYYAVSIYVGENMWYIYIRLPNRMGATHYLPLVYTTQVLPAHSVWLARRRIARHILFG